MASKSQRLSDAVEIVAEFLNSGEVSSRNANPLLFISMLRENLSETHRQMALDFICCATSVTCSPHQAYAIAEDWVRCGIIKGEIA